MPDLDVTTTKTTRRRKIQAVLAGGTVLGLGAAVTLANWTDEIFAGAEFETGTFALEASTDGPGPGSDWETGGSEDDPTVEFAFAPESVVPGGTEYQPLFVRLTEDSDLGGTLDDVDLEVTVPGDNAGNIDYTLYEIGGDEACSGGDLPEDSIAGGTLASGSGGSPSIDLSADGSGGGGQNPAVEFCFVFDFDEDDLEQGSTTEAVWEFSATSED